VVAALLLGWSPVAALALGGVTYAASSGIAAKLLSDLGRLGNRETPVVLSLLVFEDPSMAVYLPVLTAVIAGIGLLKGSVTVLVALGAMGVVLLGALRYGRVINRLVFSTDDEVFLLRVFGLALLVAGIAAQLQVSSAVGAFLIGIALSGRVAEEARSLLSPLRDLFAAVFFVFFGLQTDPSGIPPVLLAALLLGPVTAITKTGTGWWAPRPAGIGFLGRVRAGTRACPSCSTWSSTSSWMPSSRCSINSTTQRTTSKIRLSTVPPQRRSPRSIGSSARWSSCARCWALSATFFSVSRRAQSENMSTPKR